MFLANDIEVLVKTTAYFWIFYLCHHDYTVGGKLKETLRFWKVRILEQEDVLNLGLHTRLLIDSEEILYLFCSLFLLWTK